MSESVIAGDNFSALDLGAFSELERYVFKHEALSIEAQGKIFLNQPLGLTSIELSVNKLPPQVSMPFYHKHRRNEETYVFVKGRGEFQVDDEVIPVREGTVIRVAPEGVRCWRNNSTEPLYYIVIQAPEGGYPVADTTIKDGMGVEKEVVWPE